MDDKVSQIISEALNKTQTGALRWQKTVLPRSFRVSFPRSSIVVSDASPQGANWDAYLLDVYDSTGSIVTRISTDARIDEKNFRPDQADRIRALFHAAASQSENSESKLDEVLAQLTLAH
jgi:hypothetical protein